MSKTVIRADGLGKEYVIGTREAGRETFREMLTSSFAAPFRRFLRLSGEAAPEERIWALKEVSFEVAEGEVVGIIGRNGAGKSTLLKILSRITEPTEGRARIRGRVASLLEVGTGFHPELTGRENIHLNGAILGMSRAEIDRKFDEIVAFAEVEKFLDTPVKRYSSGMAVRLAFAVAAHLEPEILLVDEVLAVGDYQFQKKCLGKMGDVIKTGRSIIFVSHNMQAIQSLCHRTLLLKNGRVIQSGKNEDVVARYLNENSLPTLSYWISKQGLKVDGIRFVELRASSANKAISGDELPSGYEIIIEYKLYITRQMENLCIGFDLIGRDGVTIFRSFNTDAGAEPYQLELGLNSLKCTIPSGLLIGGMYYVAPRICIHGQRWLIAGDPLIEFQVILSHGASPYWYTHKESTRPGILAPILNWTSSQMSKINYFPKTSQE